MSTPVEKMLEGVAWEVVAAPDTGSNMLYATHSGVFELAGMKLRCYRLNDGRAIFNADDFNRFFGDFLPRESTE